MEGAKLFLNIFAIAFRTNRFIGLNFRQSNNLGKCRFTLMA